MSDVTGTYSLQKFYNAVYCATTLLSAVYATVCLPVSLCVRHFAVFVQYVV